VTDDRKGFPFFNFRMSIHMLCVCSRTACDINDHVTYLPLNPF
jgi:hypothetical protein